ncbi:MAG: serine/threonine protein kinase [Planctomycetota bacterium]
MFVAASEVPLEQRGRVIAEACRGNETLRREVEALFEQDPDAEGFLAPPDNRPLHPMPLRIDRYTIVRLIAEGGMGSVYEARQETPERTVALKVIRPGVATVTARRRFEYEGHVLGLLQHDGIARIYESGVADTGQGPQPYFAMELVNGRPLLDHADLHRLDVAQRLELMARVCDAVHHAHQKGVIHRDLKPGNIMVVPDARDSGGDPVGQPKVLDFGVARATDADLRPTTVQTGLGQLIGTVPYMSPEQASGDREQIDTRSDIYTLGVVAHELLSGDLPYELDGLLVHQAVRVIREVDPIPLGLVDRVLRGDIETIIAKALEKDRERRYDSAAALATDLRRCIANEPIAARPPSARYQLVKFARRNRPMIASLSAGLLLVVAGATAATWGMLSAQSGQRDALDARDESDEVTAFIVRMFEAVDPNVLGRDVLVRDVLEEAAPMVERDFKDRPRIAARLHEAIGDAYLAISEFDAASRHSRIAVSLDDGQVSVRTVSRLTQLAAALMLSEQTAESLVVVSRTRLLLERLHEPAHRWRAEYLLDVTEAKLMHKQGRYAEADALCEQIMSRLNDPLASGYPDVVVDVLSLSASIAIDCGDTVQARKRLQKAFAAWESSGDRSPIDGVKIALLEAAVNRVDGMLVEAIEAQDRARALAVSRLGARHILSLQSEHNYLQLLARTGRYREATTRLQSLYQLELEVLGARHQLSLATQEALAVNYATVGREEEALEMCQQLLDRRREVLGEDHPHTLNAMNNLGMAHLRLKQIDAAVAVLEETLPRRLAIYGGEHRKIVDSHENLAWAYRRADRLDEALSHARQAHDMAVRLRGAVHPASFDCASLVGGILVELGRAGEAIPILEETVRAMRGSPHESQLAGVLEELGRALIQLERFARAADCLEECRDRRAASLGDAHERVAVAAKLAEDARSRMTQDPLAPATDG